MNPPTFDVQQSAAPMFQGRQKLARFNLRFVQSSLTDAAQCLQALVAVKRSKEFTLLCTTQFKTASEKAAD